ncbi:unnamed protein product, partial [Nesidiocoris tenuis]
MKQNSKNDKHAQKIGQFPLGKVQLLFCADPNSCVSVLNPSNTQLAIHRNKMGTL